MGDPRRIKKKYGTPSHPWQATRIERERELKKQYGVKNKTELYKMNSKLKHYKDLAKSLVARIDAQAQLEMQQLRDVLTNYGLLTQEQGTDAILGLTIEKVMDRRLQSILVSKGLARTPKQARQFIVHRHILVDGSNINAPNFMVSKTKEGRIEFIASSSLYSQDHPERIRDITAQDERQLAESKRKDVRGILTDEEREAKEIAEALSKELAKEQPVTDIPITTAPKTETS